jgi:hypothetical protein
MIYFNKKIQRGKPARVRIHSRKANRRRGQRRKLKKKKKTRHINSERKKLGEKTATHNTFFTEVET